MRHRIDGRKLGRTTSHRIAMFRNMVTSLLDKERIRTTRHKAKEVRRIAEKMITLGKRGDLHARRQAAAFIREPVVVRKLFDLCSSSSGSSSSGPVTTPFHAVRTRFGSVVEFSPALAASSQRTRV